MGDRRRTATAAGFGFYHSPVFISYTTLGISCLLCLTYFYTSPLQCDELCPLGACFSPLTVKRVQITRSDGDVNTEDTYIWTKNISPECLRGEIHLITL